jgi:hypothetical protein
MTEYAIRSIDLAEIPSTPGVKFIEAQWWDDQSPLVVVSFSHHGDLTKLRRDLDKRSFLGHLKDPRDDSDVQGFAEQIWYIVAKNRFREWSHQY